jgi:hypothetical protein
MPAEPGTPNAKRVMSAQEVVADIKSGLSKLDLIRKYQLSSLGILSLFEKLISASLLDRADLDLCRDSHGTVALAALECPQCRLRIYEEAEKCPYCASDLRTGAVAGSPLQTALTYIDGVICFGSADGSIYVLRCDFVAERTCFT